MCRSLKALYPQELFKYDYRLELFLKKYENEEPFQMLDGSFVSFTFNPEVYDTLKAKSKTKVIFESQGQTYRLSHFAKNEEFGGGSNNLTRENNEIDQLSERIKALGSINIDFKGATHTVVDCISTSGTPKSDFHFISENGDPCVWVSHKHGTDATHFQQWGGVSARREPEVHAHEEVQSFIHDIQTKFPEGLTNKQSIFRRIKDPGLKMMSVYGNEYSTGIYGEQNVNYVVQGNVEIENSKIRAHKVHENGDELKYSFEPVLSAIYKGDRSDVGITNARLGIVPLGSRTMTSKI